MNRRQKKFTRKILFGSTALLTLALAAAVTVTSFTGPAPLVSPAQAQDVSLSVQFRTALEPHGRWTRHNRWGEIWIPSKRDRDWRPYTVGRWTYTDRWGWYWVSDEDFGWVTYHYGRWVMTPEYGWVWIPGTTWGPAWVQWRRGDRHAGWAPLPPQDVIYEYDDDPDFWVFVSMNDFVAPNIVRVIVPPRERVVFIRETVIINRTIIVDRGQRDRRGYFAVNPGIEPRIVAARVGRPIQVANVRPVVVAGTVGVDDAIELQGEEARKRQSVRAEIAETKEIVEPAKDVPPPQALKQGEEGRLGDRPPEAAKGAKPVPAAQVQDRLPEDDAKGAPEDAAKTKADEDAKTKAAEDAKTKADDAAKSKAVDDAKAKADDAAKAKADDAAKAKAAEDAAKAKADDAVKAKTKTDDAVKSKSDDAAKAAKDAKTKADGAAKSKAESAKETPGAKAKSDPDDTVKGTKAPAPKAEPKQAAPKSAPEPKQMAPKSAPEPKQMAPKSAPEPKQAAPKQPAPKAPAPKQPAPQAPAPEAPAAAPKGGEEKN